MSSSTDVVQRQLEAYNRKDAAGLAAIYAEDAALFAHPNTLLAKGRAAILSRYTVRFQDQALRADLLQRLTMGDMVLDHERIHSGGKLSEIFALYRVVGEHIVAAWFINPT